MLRITIPSAELWDDRKQEFVYTKEQTLQLEHSLVSLSKWESKWHKPFLSEQPSTYEETVDYIRCMTLTQNVDPKVYDYLTNKNIDEVNEYIRAPMTATTFPKENSKKSGEIVTAEIIYYWMISFNIPFECRKWHLNRLLALIRTCEAKNRPAKKMSKKEIMKRQAELNAARRAKLKSKG